MTQTTKPLKNGKKHHVYVASPFFNPNQITRVALVETLLEKLGYTYFSPRKELVCPPNASDEVRKQTFLSNEEGIKNAEMVIAITDDKDPGTIWEMGCAYANDIPVIGVAFTLGNMPFNLMLSESCVSTCKTVEELERTLVNDERIYYQGLIE